MINFVFFQVVLEDIDEGFASLAVNDHQADHRIDDLVQELAFGLFGRLADQVIYEALSDGGQEVLDGWAFFGEVDDEGEEISAGGCWYFGEISAAILVVGECLVEIDKE